MPTIPINITGASYTSRSRPLSAQVTRNFYPEVADDPAVKSPYVLHSFPGLKPFGAGTGSDRGLFEHRGVLYRVAGASLYSVNKLGVHTSLGALPGVGRCIFDGIGSNVVIASEGRVFQYNGTTVSEITDADLEMPNSCAHINQQILYDGDGGRFVSSDVGDATAIDGLNYATAESDADDLIRVYTWNQTVYLFGEESIETWYSIGEGSPPFARIEGGIISVGLGALHSVSSNDRFLYWFGDDREVYAGEASAAQRISTKAISHAFAAYDIVDDAIGWCFTWEGANFYALTFPTEDRTWCYLEGGPWFELSSGDAGGRWVGNSYAYAYGHHIVADVGNGNLYTLDPDTYTDNTIPVHRERASGPLHGGLVGAPGKTLEMSRFELIMETGVGVVSGQGSDPVVMLSFSDDGGRTWSTEQWGHIGKLGEFIFKVEWHALGRFTDRVIRIKTSDPVFYSIHSATADLEAGI